MEKGLKKKQRSEGLFGSKKERRSRILWAAVLFAAFIAMVCFLEGRRCAETVLTVNYKYETDKVGLPVRFVVVSDLHESEFGENNCELIKKIRALSPDYVLCAGDILTKYVKDEDLHIGIDLLRELAKDTPVYMSWGNHEREYIRDNGYELYTLLREAGVIILDRRYVDIPAGSGSVRVGGISWYAYNFMGWTKDFENSAMNGFMNAFCDTDGFRLLLCHIPTDYCPVDGKSEFIDWDCDLVVSGHTHGGLWQLPGIGSPYLPRQGFFPKLDRGEKQVGRAKMVIGAGLGHESFLFRLNDPCEIVVIDVVPPGE